MTLPDAPTNPVGADRTFQVDLRGLVDLLSHHLYSSPRVYLRELLQNAVDALTARHTLEPAAPAGAFGIRLYADGSVVRVEDDGVGLTEADVHTFLATIGRSSKRAEQVAEQSAVGRLLTLFDGSPTSSTRTCAHLVFWRFKWVAAALRALPEIR
ncbi:Chaperone protein HtpG [Streptomyces violaceorubidus]